MEVSSLDKILKQITEGFLRLVPPYSSHPEPIAFSNQQPLNAIIYDCEIIRCIPEKGVEQDPDLFYCDGWHDYEAMGISCIGVYDFATDSCRVFLADNLKQFQALAQSRQHIIGFNSLAFDDKLCTANGLKIQTTYDLLCEVRVAAGMPPYYVKGVTQAGYSLERLAQTNLGYGKSGDGANAAKLWQRGQYGQVIDYCLGDIAITKKLFEMRSHLADPNNGQVLKLKEPVRSPHV